MRHGPIRQHAFSQQIPLDIGSTRDWTWTREPPECCLSVVGSPRMWRYARNVSAQEILFPGAPDQFLPLGLRHPVV